MRKQLPEYTPGGRAKDFTASLDIRLRRGDWITIGSGENKEIIGQQVKFKIHKSKVSTPQRTGMWETYIEEGGPVPKGHIDNFKELVLASISYGVVDKSGAWFKYKDKFNVQGADAVVSYFRDNVDIFEEVKAETLKLAFEQVADAHEKFLLSLSEEEKLYYDEHGTLDGFGEEVTIPDKTPKKKPSTKKKAENSKKVVKK